MRYVTGELLVSGVCYHVNEMLPTIGYGCELVCFFFFFFFFFFVFFFVFSSEIEIVEWKCLHGFKFITMSICNKSYRIIAENIHKYKGVCQVGLCLGTEIYALNGLSEPGPINASSIGYLLWFNCGWTSTALIISFTSITHSIKHRFYAEINR